VRRVWDPTLHCFADLDEPEANCVKNEPVGEVATSEMAINRSNRVHYVGEAFVVVP
jgi:hypothetical protein